MELIPLLITLIILGVVAYIALWAINQVPMPQPIKVAVILVGADHHPGSASHDALPGVALMSRGCNLRNGLCVIICRP